jgi:fructose-1-phosphate kinase PfkB-like protein
VVKVNAAEAGEASAVPVVDIGSAVAAAGVLRERGAVSVIVSMGTAGAVVVDGAGTTRLLPPDIRGLYPVGSGDAFLGGLAVALALGEPLEAAAQLGMAAAIANAQVPGAGVLDPGAIPRLLAQILLAGT